MGNDIIDYAHERAAAQRGGKIRIPKGLRDFSKGFVHGFTGTLKAVASNPVAQGVATNLITGALMGGAGKPKRFAKGSQEAKDHMARIRGMKKSHNGNGLFPAGSGVKKENRQKNKPNIFE